MLDEIYPKKISALIDELPITYQSPTMAPYCEDSEKYSVVDNLIKEFNKMYLEKNKIVGKSIIEILKVNGIRFTLEDGSWGLVRASSNKPSLVVVTESMESKDDMKNIFNFIDQLLKKTKKVGKYDQKI